MSPFGFCGRSFAPFHDLEIAHGQGEVKSKLD